MTLPLIEIFFSLILLLLWFTLVNLRERYLELNLKGWGEMSLGVFFIFIGSLLELGENIPEIQPYLSVKNMPWGEFCKISLYLIGIILVSFSPINWLSSILNERDRFKNTRRKYVEINSFLSELNKPSGQLKSKDALSSILNFSLSYLCRELKADSGAIFLFYDSNKELSLAHFMGLSLNTIENVKKTIRNINIFACALKDHRVETSGEILNSDWKLAYAVKDDNLESCICIPLYSNEEPIGVVSLFSMNKYHFENPDSENLLELAGVLGRRIQGLLILERLEQQKGELKIAREKESALKLIAEDLVTDNFEEVFSRIVKTGAEIFHPCECKIYLREGDTLILRATSEPEFSRDVIYLDGDCWFKEAMEDTEIKSLSVEQDPELKEKEIIKVVAIPLKIKEKTSGLIVFEFKTRQDTLSLSELDFVKTLALEATVALGGIFSSQVLEQKEKMISSFLDSFEDRVTVHDRNQRIVKINKAGLKFLNLTEEEVLGKNCFQVLYQQNQPEVCPCYITFKEKKPYFKQVKSVDEKSKDEGLLKIWTYPLLDDKGEVEMVVEYAKFEKVPESLSKTDKGKKEVSKEFFNDLNNILAGILGNAELIRFQIKSYKDLVSNNIADQMNLIEELVIEGSKLIREVKGETEEIPEKKMISDKEIDIAEEKRIAESLKILAIDDQKIIRDLLESILLGLGHSIKVASSGKDGLVLFQQDGFDLVITDLGMPEMSGWEVSQRVKEIRKETPVIMITGWGVSFEQEKIKEFGVDYLLPKPFRVEQLSRLLDQIKDEKIRKRNQV
ncbi:MAG: response regulator [candidate division Zixibacteria bacterium]|nr:response regulator [candidate division Zixibacteria bacterium]